MAKKQPTVKTEGPTIKFYPSNANHKKVSFIYNGLRYEVAEYGLTAPTLEAEKEWLTYPQLVSEFKRPIPIDPDKIKESLIEERTLNNSLRSELESIKAKLAAYEGATGLEDGD